MLWKVLWFSLIYIFPFLLSVFISKSLSSLLNYKSLIPFYLAAEPYLISYCYFFLFDCWTLLIWQINPDIRLLNSPYLSAKNDVFGCCTLLILQLFRAIFPVTYKESENFLIIFLGQISFLAKKVYYIRLRKGK